MVIEIGDDPCKCDLISVLRYSNESALNRSCSSPGTFRAQQVIIIGELREPVPHCDSTERRRERKYIMPDISYNA